MQIKTFKCRASKAGDMMTNGRGKDTMGQTCITYLQEWLIEQATGKRKEIESKYLRHGIHAEKAVLSRASNYFDKQFVKNKEQIENDFFTGEFDAQAEGIVIDAKAPWSVHTMPYFDNEPPKGYYRQLQVYMALTGVKKAALFYGLEDHSDGDINSLAWKLAKKEAQDLGEEEFEMEMCHWEQAEKELSYAELPKWMRQKVYEFDRDDALIEAMQLRVIECRKVIESDLLPKFLSNEIK